MGSVLIVSPLPIRPANAGNRARVASLVDLLEQLGHTVYFMHVEQESGDSQRMQKDLGSRYVNVPYSMPRSLWRHLARRIASRLKHKSMYNYGVDEWYDPVLDQHLDRFFAEHTIDVAIVEYVFLSRALLRVPASTKKLIDTHDVFSNRYQRYLDNGVKPDWYSCSPRQEAKGLARADAILAIQSTEAAHLHQVIDRPVLVVGHAVRVQPLPLNHLVQGRILLVGSGNSINLSAFEWMQTEIMPRVRQHHDAAELVVCGSISRHVKPEPGVTVLGEFDDLAEAYATSQIVVNPVQFGTGLKIKSVEALGFGRALVTTPCGAEGIEEGSGSAFRIGSTPEAFAARLVELIGDPAAARQLGEAGAEFARQFNRRIAEQLIQLLPEVS